MMVVEVDPASLAAFQAAIGQLERDLANFPEIAGGEVKPALEKALMVLQGEAADYPPAPPSRRYRRTGTLGRLWASGARVVEGSGINLVGRVGNRAPYGPYVQDPDRQAAWHRGRWRTTDQVKEDGAPAVGEVLGQAGVRIVEKLGA
jgi:hypothetical protein